MAKNHHWRCGALNYTDEKPCKNIVQAKGDRCYRHKGYRGITAEAALVGVTEQLDDDAFDKLVIYVQQIKDQNLALKREVEYLRTTIRNISGIIAGEY